MKCCCYTVLAGVLAYHIQFLSTNNYGVVPFLIQARQSLIRNADIYTAKKPPPFKPFKTLLGGGSSKALIKLLSLANCIEQNKQYID